MPCEQCGRPVKARGLCTTHYSFMYRNDPIHLFGRSGTIRNGRVRPLVCICLHPIPTRLLLWDSVECARCGRKIVE